jgi:hypothetical protein
LSLLLPSFKKTRTKRKEKRDLRRKEIKKKKEGYLLVLTIRTLSQVRPGDPFSQGQALNEQSGGTGE